jgi:two-component sensor histidine kinase
MTKICCFKNLLLYALVIKSWPVAGFYIIFCLLFILFVGIGIIQYFEKKRRLHRIRSEKMAFRDQLLENEISEKKQITDSKNRLQKEIQVRVQENLDMVMKLMNFQYNSLSDKSALQAVRKSQSRLKALALIHENLYEIAGTEYVRMAHYIVDLVKTVKGYNKTARQVNIQCFVNPLDLELTLAEPLGLLLNELLMNSLKHGLPVAGDQEISVFMQRSGNNVVMSVSDNGQDMPADFNIDNSPTLGIKLIRGLCEQIGGTLSFLHKDGLTVSLTFRAD